MLLIPDLYFPSLLKVLILMRNKIKMYFWSVLPSQGRCFSAPWHWLCNSLFCRTDQTEYFQSVRPHAPEQMNVHTKIIISSYTQKTGIGNVLAEDLFESTFNLHPLSPRHRRIGQAVSVVATATDVNPLFMQKAKRLCHHLHSIICESGGVLWSKQIWRTVFFCVCVSW